MELKFVEGFRMSFTDRSVLDVLGFNGIPDQNRGGYFIGNTSLVAKMEEPIKNDFPADLTAGTNLLFLYTDIIEYQHVADVKAPLLRIIDVTRETENSDLKNSQTIQHKSYSELQFKKLLSNILQTVQIELRSETLRLVPFVGTGKVVLTLKFRNFR